MPVVAYFRNVGAVLLALLFIADFYLPRPAVDRRAKAYPPTIRIYSDPKWPDRIVLDTTQVMMTPVAPVASNIALARRDAGTPTIRSGVQEAFALASRADLRREAAPDQNKRPQRVATRTKRHTKSRLILVAQPRQFGWFGSGYW
jgi:hypothetical protein